MNDKKRSLRDELTKLIAAAASDTSNVASAINVGESGRKTSVSSRQRVVQKDGVTTRTTAETRREGRTDG